ncbi:MAG: hypothetical protein GXP05_04925 [Alphaproteobacteria bacterium]|nr:hypothetical protein [Alphaproteobacteria bacterium]
MIDPTPDEQDALNAGAQSGGAYLDSLGASDLAELSLTDWQAFIEIIVTAYCDHLRDLAGRDQDHITSMREGVPF